MLWKKKNFWTILFPKNSIRIDPDMVSAIMKVEEPSSKKEVQSFIRQINFLRRFIPSFVEILMNITNMLKKDHEIKWIVYAKKSFRDIKQSISEAPMLVSPYFDIDFLVFSYASKHTIAAVLLKRMIKVRNIL